MQGYNHLEVNLFAVGQNIDKLQTHCQVMAMVKANAYGAGAIAIAKFLETRNIQIFGVSHLSEALALREAGITAEICTIFAALDQYELVALHNVQICLSNLAECRALENVAKAHNKKIKVHLHIDTGMKRFGALPADALALANAICDSPWLTFYGAMTHLIGSSDPTFDPISKRQISSFFALLSQFKRRPALVHVANSAAARRFDLQGTNMTRIGLAYLGLHSNPIENQGLGLTPALKLTSTLAFINEGSQGDGVGYYHSYRIAQKQGRIGVVAIGYHDGFGNFLAQDGYVMIRNKRAKILSKICMDFTLVDLTDIPNARVGDSVTLFDQNLTAEEVARWGKLNVREFLSKLGPRVKRKYTYEESRHAREQEKIHTVV